MPWEPPPQRLEQRPVADDAEADSATIRGVREEIDALVAFEPADEQDALLGLCVDAPLAPRRDRIAQDANAVPPHPAALEKLRHAGMGRDHQRRGRGQRKQRGSHALASKPPRLVGEPALVAVGGRA